MTPIAFDIAIGTTLACAFIMRLMGH